MDLSNIKVLVTGGAGFLGSHISEGLLNAGARVNILDTFLSGRESNITHLKNRVKFYHGDILDQSLVKEAAKGVDVVVHSAFPMAICDRSLNKQYIEAGTVGIYNVLNSALAEDAKLIYVSSISVYGRQKYLPVDEEHPVHPMLIYGATKLAGEFYCQVMAEEYGLQTVILRYSDIFGPRNGRISAPINFLLKSLHKQPLEINGDGSQIRSYTYVSDAVDATLLAMVKPEAKGQIINVAGDDNISILELAQKVRKLTGMPLDIKCAGTKNPDTRNYIIDNNRAKKLLGFKPRVSIDDGLELTLQWLKDNPLFYNPGLQDIAGGR